MKSAIGVLGVTLALAVPMFGDVTVKQSTGGKGLGISGSGTTTTYIKGMKMRSEAEVRGTMMTTIFDVENQKMYTFDSKKKSADVWDMQAFSQEMAKSVSPREIQASLKPNGEKKEIGGKSANGYDLRITVQAMAGGQEGMAMLVTLQGPIWVVKDAPGTKDYIAFYKAAVEKGWIFSDPRAAKGSPGQARAMAEMHRQLAATGGVPFESELSVSMSGDGPMAAVMSRMGNMTITSSVQSIDTSALDEALFAPPAGYKLVPRK
jgi:hypothetical protein